MLRLDDVTLIGVDCVEINRLLLAVDICQHYCQFGAVKVLTSVDHDDGRIVKIAPLSYDSYSQFIIKDLHRYVDTPYALLVQYDGFVLNPEAWTDEFLEYDYVASPWRAPIGGIGGFSLRSRRFLEATSKYVEGPPWSNEDQVVCLKHGALLVERGMKFAPLTVARRFAFDAAGSVDGRTAWDGEFGFHNLGLTDLSNWKFPVVDRLDAYALGQGVLNLGAVLWRLSRDHQHRERRLRRLQQLVRFLQRFSRATLVESAAKLAGFTNGVKCMSPLDLEDLAVEVLHGHPNASQLGVAYRRDAATPEEAIVRLDCKKRVHTCRAACCSFGTRLTRDEVQNPVYRIDVNHPFTLARDPETRLCVHSRNSKCTIYEERPIECRRYSCATDKRIWEDFERMIPGPVARALARRLEGRKQIEMPAVVPRLEMQRWEVINELIRIRRYRSYLEIGVGNGVAFRRVRCEFKVGVDPNPHSAANICLTSDEFFKKLFAGELLLGREGLFDIVFIDGLHRANQAYADIVSSLDVLAPDGCIVVHDCRPLSRQVQAVRRTQAYWNGDVWKAWVRLRTERDDLHMFCVDTDEGCGIIEGGRQAKLVVECELNYSNYVHHREEWLNLKSVQYFLDRVNKSNQGGYALLQTT